VAQDAPIPPEPRQLITAHEMKPLVALFAASAALMPFDRRLAHAAAPRPQLFGARDRTAQAVGTLGDPGAVAIAFASLAVGRLTHHATMADVGLHASEALLMSGALTVALKQGIGRARPRTVQLEDPFAFAPFRGEPGHASLPSGHTSAAFTVAAVLDRELHRHAYGRRHARLAAAASSMLYGAATAVGVSRMVQRAHWSSDVAAGAGIGIMSGFAIVRQRHTGPAARWERWLIGR
jgi:membrane-associated phospholipid phosphatase